MKVEKTREKCLEQLKKEKNERGSLEGEINEIIFRLETIYKSNQKFQDVRFQIVKILYNMLCNKPLYYVIDLSLKILSDLSLSLFFLVQAELVAVVFTKSVSAVLSL